MGGYGSGGQSGPTVESYRRIDVRALNRQGLLTTAGCCGLWHWSVDGERTASVLLEASSVAVTLDYESQREARCWRLQRKADKVRARLGVEPQADIEAKPPRMHWRTFDRLTDQLERADRGSLMGLIELNERFTHRLRRR